MRGTREQVITEARSWIGTRYLRGGMIKGDKPGTGGVDCATLLYRVYRDCGLIPPSSMGDGGSGPSGEFFSDDWFLNTKEEHYFAAVMRQVGKFVEGWAFASQQIRPGSLVLAKVGSSKVYNHGGIATAWPKLVHAYEVVEEVDVRFDPKWQGRQIAVFDPWGEA